MADKLKKGNVKVRMGKMFLASTFAALLAAFVLIMIVAVIMDKLNLDEADIRLMVYMVYILSALAAGFVAGKWKREKKFIWGAFAGGVWMILILAVSLITNGAILEVKDLFLAVACLIAGGMLGGMLA